MVEIGREISDVLDDQVNDAVIGRVLPGAAALMNGWSPLQRGSGFLLGREARSRCVSP